ncbi:MAG: PQQ-binding-like beta-propeller repeat protein [Planctomycetota bacterium]
MRPFEANPQPKDVVDWGTGRRDARGTVGLALALLISMTLIAPAEEAAPEKELAKIILQGAGIKSGQVLCAHLGCGEGKLTLELAREGRFLIQGLAADQETVLKARRTLQATGLSSAATAIFCDFKELPYTENIVNLIVAEDLPALLKSGLSLKEIFRVICPLGTAYLGLKDDVSEAKLKAGLQEIGITQYEIVKNQGSWLKAKKPWPKEMDEWNHWRNKADNNPVSKDTLIGPPRQLRWLADPRWLIAGSTGHVRVSANGRLFYTSGHFGVDGVKYDKNPFDLIARDGFNGLFLWKRSFPAFTAETESKKLTNSFGPTTSEIKRVVVAAGDRLYVVLETGKSLEALDAATGETILVYKEGGAPTDVLYVQDTLILAGGGPVRALDPIKGTVRWTSTYSKGSYMIAAGDGKLFVPDASGKFVCLNIETGKEVWNVAQGFGELQFYQNGILFFLQNTTTHAISALDGKPLWNYQAARGYYGKPTRPTTPKVFYANGLCWNDAKITETKFAYIGLDPLTGKEVKRVLHDGFGTRCFPDFFSEHYVLATDNHCLNLKTGEYYHGANFTRAACAVGGMAANGLFYPFVQTCMCYPQTRGMTAVASAKHEELLTDKFRWENVLEQGPAYGKALTSAEIAPPTDWPDFRHDPLRTGWNNTVVPADGQKLWEVALGDQVTAPVIAGGRVYIGAVNSQRLFALNEKTGERIWDYIASGRFQTPPTIFEGLCLFGTLDGWVTCLTADKGELVWRFRAAPEPRQIIAYEGLESPWPVYGVVIQKGTVGFAAGRNSDADGGVYIYTLEPKTGKVLWKKRHFTSSWAYKQDVATEKYLWIQPRGIEGATKKPAPQEWTVKKVTDAALFKEGGVYKIDPGTKRIVWLTDAELQKDQEKSKWETWKADVENLIKIIGGISVRIREYLVGDIPVAGKDGFHVKSWRFGWQDGESYYNTSALSSLRGGATLMQNVSNWRCFSWMEHQQYYGDGRPIVYDDKWCYGSKSPKEGQDRIDIVGKGVKIIAWSQAPAPDGAKRNRKPFLWEVKDIPIRTLSMAGADQVLFVAGVPDEGLTQDLPPEQFWPPLEGKKGGDLYALSKTDGKLLHKQKIEYMPIFDGMAVANGRLYISVEGGKLLCFGK